MKKHRKWIVIVSVAVMCVCLLTGCGRKIKNDIAGSENIILCTTFAAYDWVREILGDTDMFTCQMLVENGVDIHSYQPSAQDIMKIADCRILVYVGGESDTWVSDALSESGNEDIVAISLLNLVGDRALDEVELAGVESHHHHDHEAHDGHEDEFAHEDESEHEYDEHVWLSLRNAQVCVNTLADVITSLDPEHKEAYEHNAQAYREKLQQLDAKYDNMRKNAQRDTILIGDRFPFLYLMEDYDIHYYAAYSGCSADAEASVHTVLYLADRLQTLKLPVIYVVDQGMDNLAKTIAECAGMQVEIYNLSSMQSVTKEDIEKGNTYLSYMEENLQVLTNSLID